MPSERLQRLLERVGEVCPIPAAATRVMAVARDELPLTLFQTAASCSLPGSPDHLLQVALEAGASAEQALRQSA